MSAQALSGLLLLVVAATLANLPFANERLFGLVRRASVKSMGLRMLELLIWFGVTLGFGVLLESRFGPVYPQGWEFYGIAACLYLVLAYPGFVWRYLRRAQPDSLKHET